MLELRRAQAGEIHLDTMLAMNNLAVTRFSEGDVAGARELLEPVLKLRAQHLGAEHPLTIATMINLGWVLVDQGHVSEARKLATDALALARRVLGADTQNTGQAAYMLRVIDRKLTASQGNPDSWNSRRCAASTGGRGLRESHGIYRTTGSLKS